MLQLSLFLMILDLGFRGPVINQLACWRWEGFFKYPLRQFSLVSLDINRNYNVEIYIFKMLRVLEFQAFITSYNPMRDSWFCNMTLLAQQNTQHCLLSKIICISFFFFIFFFIYFFLGVTKSRRDLWRV